METWLYLSYKCILFMAFLILFMENMEFKNRMPYFMRFALSLNFLWRSFKSSLSCVMHDTMVGIFHTNIFGFANQQVLDLFWGRQGFSCDDKWNYCRTLSWDSILGFCCLQHSNSSTWFAYMNGCMKIIKNNKDFVDHNPNEIKLLKYINKLGDCVLLQRRTWWSGWRRQRLPASCQQLVFDICRHHYC